MGAFVTVVQTVSSPSNSGVCWRLRPVAASGQESTMLLLARAIFNGEQGVGGGSRLTVKLHPAAWPRPSLAVQKTVVRPGGNKAPEGGLQVTVSVPPQLEAAPG